MAMRYMTPWKWGLRSVPVSRELENRPIEVFQREMNRLFDEFFKGFGLRPFPEDIESYGEFFPHVNMTEDEKSIRISAELPGLDEKDIEISISRDSITIKGQKKDENEQKEGEGYYMERSFGSFTRVLPIPREVNTEKAEATFKKGILTITLPKLEREKEVQKKIQVKSH